MRDLNQMKNIDIATVEMNTLVDINDVKINAKDKNERLLEYFQKIKNPYCFKCGEYAVKLSFSDMGTSLNERFREYIRRIAASGVDE